MWAEPPSQHRQTCPCRYFGFITKHPADHRFACHVFVSEDSTKALAESVGYVYILLSTQPEGARPIPGPGAASWCSALPLGFPRSSGELSPDPSAGGLEGGWRGRVSLRSSFQAWQLLGHVFN